jgi:hypothetical protein
MSIRKAETISRTPATPQERTAALVGATVLGQLTALSQDIEKTSAPSAGTVSSWVGRLEATVKMAADLQATGRDVPSAEAVWGQVAEISAKLLGELADGHGRASLRQVLAQDVTDLVDTAKKPFIVLGEISPVGKTLHYEGTRGSVSAYLSVSDQKLRLAAFSEPTYGTLPAPSSIEKPAYALIVDDRVLRLGDPTPGKVDMRTDRDDPPDLADRYGWSVDVAVKPGSKVSLISGDRVVKNWTVV